MILALLLLAQAPADCTWTDHQRASAVAFARHDWPSFKYHLLRVQERLGFHPALVLALARADARLGDTAAAFNRLRLYAAMGLARDISADSSFLPLHSFPSWQNLQRRLAENLKPVGANSVAFALPDTDFVAEDIAFDPAGKRFLLTSIRHRKLVAASFPSGPVRSLVAEGQPGIWGLLAVGVDPQRKFIWATTEAMPQVLGLTPADSGRAAVLRFDLQSGRLLKSYPANGEPGDLVVASNGEVFVSDGRSGIVYAIRPGKDSLETFVPAGTFISPQGPTLSADESTLFIADYALGIAAVDRASGRVSWLAHPADIALTGIDGITRDGTSLIAVQNGVTPNRVIRLTLGSEGITGLTVLAQDTSLIKEPNHGVVVEGSYYFIANSGFDRFDPAGNRLPGPPLLAPRVIRIPLADSGLQQLLHDYIALYRADSLDRWRTLFLSGFTVAFTNRDGTITERNLDQFVERQRLGFARSPDMHEVLENVAIQQRESLASVWADFVFTADNQSRRGRLTMLCIRDRGVWWIQSLLFSYLTGT